MTCHRKPERGLSRLSSRLVCREPRRIPAPGIIKIASFLARHVGMDGSRCVWTNLLNTKGLRLEDEPIHAAEDPGMLPVKPRPFQRRGWGLGLVAAWLLWLSWAGMGHGAPGDLDPTFGTGGIAITFGPSDSANALVVQPDGKLVVAGTSSGDGVNHVLLVRYLPNGRGDGSFGPGGKITTTMGSHSGANAVLQQPDGKLVVAGRSFPLLGGQAPCYWLGSCPMAASMLPSARRGA